MRCGKPNDKDATEREYERWRWDERAKRRQHNENDITYARTLFNFHSFAFRRPKKIYNQNNIGPMQEHLLPYIIYLPPAVPPSPAHVHLTRAKTHSTFTICVCVFLFYFLLSAIQRFELQAAEQQPQIISFQIDTQLSLSIWINAFHWNRSDGRRINLTEKGFIVIIFIVCHTVALVERWDQRRMLLISNVHESRQQYQDCHIHTRC